MSFLVMDIGNTRLKWALYAEPDPRSPLLHGGVALLEDIDQLARVQWHGLPHPEAMLGCVVAGEAVRRRVEEQLGMWQLQPRWVVAQAEAAGVHNGYEHPARLGADRWAALVGARHRLLRQAASQPARPAVVVMVGTAVTVDALDDTGRFLGGCILPGYGLMLAALETGTAGLRVPSGEVRDFPTNTSDALMSGGTDAIAGAVERMARRLSTRTGQAPAVLLSGGAAIKVAPSLGLPHEMVDTLVFEGLLQLAAEPA
ncbi:MAG: type III pantothenate kinase [Pseudomonadota bacterium]